jgi:hypothetical protein
MCDDTPRAIDPATLPAVRNELRRQPVDLGNPTIHVVHDRLLALDPALEYGAVEIPLASLGRTGAVMNGHELGVDQDAPHRFPVTFSRSSSGFKVEADLAPAPSGESHGDQPNELQAGIPASIVADSRMHSVLERHVKIPVTPIARMAMEAGAAGCAPVLTYEDGTHGRHSGRLEWRGR